MNNLQIHMWSGTREAILEKHDIYVDLTRNRVLAQFADIEGDAEKFRDEELARAGQCAGPDDDLDDIAESVHEKMEWHYGLLADLKKQMLLGALAGCFHRWDVELRDFIEWELLHYMDEEHAEKIAWDPNLNNVFDLLAQFGLDCRTEPYFPNIDACRLIVNVYKHGKGRSATDLHKTYPQFMRDPLGGNGLAPWRVDHQWLEISEADFVTMAASIREFWVTMPERLFLSLPDTPGSH